VRRRRLVDDLHRQLVRREPLRHLRGQRIRAATFTVADCTPRHGAALALLLPSTTAAFRLVSSPDHEPRVPEKM
jgi:hypothetical protein